MRITGAVAMKPCCSELAALVGTVVAPGQSMSIPAVLKVRSNQFERQRVEFVVETNDVDRPVLRYALQTTICPEWETQAVAEPTRDLPVGRGAGDVIRAISRRVAGEGGTLPIAVEADHPLTVRFLGEPMEWVSPDLVTIASREIEITIPSSSAPAPAKPPSVSSGQAGGRNHIASTGRFRLGLA